MELFMTINPLTSKSTIKRRKFFDCVPNTDGCDETFEIVSRTTGNRVAWTGYWEAKKPAQRAAEIITKALNSAFAIYGVSFCLSALAKEQCQIAIVWTVDDVLEMRPDLNEDQAWKVLLFIEKHHDAGIGINWEVIEATAQILFGDEPESI
jgi:hypothetical protein